MNEEDIYIIDSKGDSTFFLPPNPGLGEAQIQYCNSAPILLRRVKKFKVNQNEKIEGRNHLKGFLMGILNSTCEN